MFLVWCEFHKIDATRLISQFQPSPNKTIAFNLLYIYFKSQIKKIAQKICSTNEALWNFELNTKPEIDKWTVFSYNKDNVNFWSFWKYWNASAGSKIQLHSLQIHRILVIVTLVVIHKSLYSNDALFLSGVHFACWKWNKRRTTAMVGRTIMASITTNSHQTYARYMRVCQWINGLSTSNACTLHYTAQQCN